MKVPTTAALGKATVTFRLKRYDRLAVPPVTYEIEVLSPEEVKKLRAHHPKAF
ncbi:MAG: hypothetical protein ACHQ50_12520 [Fimbriimonadales bacterium]